MEVRPPAGSARCVDLSFSLLQLLGRLAGHKGQAVAAVCACVSTRALQDRTGAGEERAHPALEHAVPTRGALLSLLSTSSAGVSPPGR